MILIIFEALIECVNSTNDRLAFKLFLYFHATLVEWRLVFDLLEDK